MREQHFSSPAALRGSDLSALDMLRLRARLLIQDFQQAGAFERPAPSSQRLATLRSEGRRWLDAFDTLSRRLPSSALASTLPAADLLSRLTQIPHSSTDN